MRKVVFIAAFILQSNLLFAQFESYFLASAQVNYNVTFSSKAANQLWADFNYRGEAYWPLDRYYPLLEQLNWEEATWTLKPTPQINFFFGSENPEGVHYGANVAFTSNISECKVVSTVDKASATLHFEGKELRLMLQPTFGVTSQEFVFDVHLTFGLGFAKNYNTFITAVDENNKTYYFTSDYDNFYNRDYSVGCGFWVGYYLHRNLILGFNYQVYKVNTGLYNSQQWLDFSQLTNGFWNHSFGLRLAINSIN